MTRVCFLGRTLRRPVPPQQANARGAAFIAAVALGDIGFHDIHRRGGRRGS
jgi:hypothetical protein